MDEKKNRQKKKKITRGGGSVGRKDHRRMTSLGQEHCAHARTRFAALHTGTHYATRRVTPTLWRQQHCLPRHATPAPYRGITAVSPRAGHYCKTPGRIGISASAGSDVVGRTRPARGVRDMRAFSGGRIARAVTMRIPRSHTPRLARIGTLSDVGRRYAHPYLATAKSSTPARGHLPRTGAHTLLRISRCKRSS